MTAAAATKPITEEVEERAQAWIVASFRDPYGKGYWQNRYDDTNMETAFCAGFAAGMEHARRIFTAS